MSRAPTLIAGKPGTRYIWPPDDPEYVLPRVSTILDNVAKQEDLVPAAGWRVAEYAVDNILRWEGMPPGDAKQLLSGVARRNWDLKAEKGTIVHDAISVWLDEEPVVEPDNIPYVAGAQAFLTDKAHRVIYHEEVVFNLTYQYAGRVDAVIERHNGPLAVVDWKTGKHIDPFTALQVNAYANAEFVGKDDGRKAKLPPIDEGWVVQLPGDGSYVAYPVEIHERHFKAFVAYRSVQKWRDMYEDNALGEAQISSKPEEKHTATTN